MCGTKHILITISSRTIVIRAEQAIRSLLDRRVKQLVEVGINQLIHTSCLQFLYVLRRNAKVCTKLPSGVVTKDTIIVSASVRQHDISTSVEHSCLSSRRNEITLTLCIYTDTLGQFFNSVLILHNSFTYS